MDNERLTDREETMNVRIEELTEGTIVRAPEWAAHPYSCKWCLYWEEPEPLTDPKKEAFQKKLAWLRRVRKEFGGCGKLLYVDQDTAGYAQYAPARFLPNAAAYPAGPVSEDAVFIACLFIPIKEYRGRGLGSLLLEAIIADLRGRGVPAIETFARKGSPENPAGPIELYSKHGFHVLRDDDQFPLMRLPLG